MEKARQHSALALSMRQWAVHAVLCVSAVLFSPGALADLKPENISASTFQRAKALWLSDDDKNSLPSLALLAREGNTAARILLSRIEATDLAPSTHVSRLSRDGRMQIFRAPSNGALFPKNWLSVERGRGNRLASALFQSTAFGTDVDLVRELYSLGEVEAAEHRIRKIAVDGSPKERGELISVLDQGSELRPYLEAYIAEVQSKSTGITALQAMLRDKSLDWTSRDVQEAAKFLGIGYQGGHQIQSFGPQNSLYMNVADWVGHAQSTRPIARVCSDSCSSSELNSCLIEALGIIGGYYEAIRFNSPTETLIPQGRFLESNRAAGMIRRRLQNARTDTDVPIFARSELTGRSECLASVVFAN